MEIEIEGFMVEGRDKNTKFFHMLANIRRVGNCINSIEVEGRRMVDKEGIREAVR